MQNHLIGETRYNISRPANINENRISPVDSIKRLAVSLFYLLSYSNDAVPPVLNIDFKPTTDRSETLIVYLS